MQCSLQVSEWSQHVADQLTAVQGGPASCEPCSAASCHAKQAKDSISLQTDIGAAPVRCTLW